MLPVYIQCKECKYYRKDSGLWSCDAYPDGIPKGIIYKGPNNVCAENFRFEKIVKKSMLRVATIRY